MLLKRNKTLFSHDWKSISGDFAVELRKQKRNLLVSTKRKELLTAQTPSLDAILNIEQGINVFESIRILKNCDLSEINSSTLTPQLISFMLISSEDDLLDISFILCNIAASGITAVETLVNCDYIQHCTDLIPDASLELCDNLVWAIANIAGSGKRYQERILEGDYLQNIYSYLMSKEVKTDIISTVSWSLRNLTQGDLRPNSSNIANLIEILKEFFLLQMPSIDENNLWAVYNVTCLGYIEDSLCTEIISSVIKYSSDKNLTLQLPACKILGNIASSSESRHTQFLIDIGITDILQYNIQSKHFLIIRESCWTLSNLLAGTNDQVKSVLS